MICPALSGFFHSRIEAEGERLMVSTVFSICKYMVSISGILMTTHILSLCLGSCSSFIPADSRKDLTVSYGRGWSLYFEKLFSRKNPSLDVVIIWIPGLSIHSRIYLAASFLYSSGISLNPSNRRSSLGCPSGLLFDSSIQRS